MAYTRVAFGKHVQEESPNKLNGIERHWLPLPLFCVILEGESDPAVIEANDSVIGYGYAVGVAPEVAEDVGRRLDDEFALVSAAGSC